MKDDLREKDDIIDDMSHDYTYSNKFVWRQHGTLTVRYRYEPIEFRSITDTNSYKITACRYVDDKQ